ncbi:hypothetical protein [Actinomyces trachealis]|uniref:hypothetical protein n=1 Tax=Actinomyces trachealis TaxID=2763540 RepID=UPI001892A2B1|nr:hypothetical protein [Actinomyces trachealis]
MSAESNAEPSERKRGGSRRAMRDAERVAEREAYLTGQQPLLTRREMKRLREESEALQAAIDSGEITLDQAKALQNPLAEQPNIDVPVLHATGSHAALSEEMLEKLDAEATGKGKHEQDASDESKPADEVKPTQDAEGKPEEKASEKPEKPEADAADCVDSADSAEDKTEEGVAKAELRVDEPSAKSEAGAESEAGSELAEDAEQVAGTDEAAEVSDDAASIPETKSDADAQDESKAEFESKPVGEDQVTDESESESEGSDTEDKQDAAPKTDADQPVEADTASSHEAAQRKADLAEGAAASPAESQTNDASAAEKKAAEEKTATEKVTAAKNDQKVPKRRPIVRVPGVAQGVRSVNHDTGELEAIKPVEGEDYEPGETPHWKSLRSSGFKVRDGGFAVDDEGPKLAPTASSAEQPDELPEMKPDLTGRMAGAGDSDADQRTWQDITAIPGLQAEVGKGSGSSEVLRYLLLGLLALVILLVVGAIVWAFIAKNSDSAALVSQWAPLLI